MGPTLRTTDEVANERVRTRCAWRAIILEAGRDQRGLEESRQGTRRNTWERGEVVTRVDEDIDTVHIVLDVAAVTVGAPVPTKLDQRWINCCFQKSSVDGSSHRHRRHHTEEDFSFEDSEYDHLEVIPYDFPRRSS
jgi:hypothetical protein